LLQNSEIIIYDDGSSNPAVASELEEFCRANAVLFSRGRENKGVPAAWNQITQQANGEVVILLNDDVRPTAPGWLMAISTAFELNPRVGIVYWCQKQVDSSSGALLRYTSDSKYLVEKGIRFPLLRSNFCGAFFAFRKSLWESIKQPDDTTGFWEDLNAYGEEMDFSSECHQRGVFILQLPIVWEHLQSQTFARNPNQKLRAKLSPYLSEDEYFHICRQYLGEPGVRDPSPFQSIKNIVKSLIRRVPDPGANGVSKLKYSAAMVVKKWQTRTIIGYSGGAYISQLLRDGFPTAIQDAIKSGNYSVPDSFLYRDHNSELEVAIKDCLSDPSKSLV
jgi:hypothetical protein